MFPVRSTSTVRYRRRTCCVLISTLESQHPNPGCEWYQPTTISGLCYSVRTLFRSSWVPEDSPPSLLEHFDHLGLENMVHRLYRYSGTGLRHGKDVDNLDRIFVHELSEHQAHNFHGHTCSAVFEHLKNHSPFSVLSSMKRAGL